MKRLLMLTLCMLLSACSSVVLKPDMDRVRDQSKAYQEGYYDGCHSGFVAGGSIVHFFKKDTDRQLDDVEYANGWKQAYRECKSDFREMCKSKEWVSKSHLYCSDVRQQGLHKIDE